MCHCFLGISTSVLEFCNCSFGFEFLAKSLEERNLKEEKYLDFRFLRLSMIGISYPRLLKNYTLLTRVRVCMRMKDFI